jgi:hypothetical protein
MFWFLEDWNESETLRSRNLQKETFRSKNLQEYLVRDLAVQETALQIITKKLYRTSQLRRQETCNHSERACQFKSNFKVFCDGQGSKM